MLSPKLAVLTAVFLLAIACAGPKAFAGSAYAGGYTRFVYQTETASGRVERSTTEITPQEDGTYRVVTTTEGSVSQNDIRLSFFGTAAESLGLFMSEDSDSPFDLSPLGALASQSLEPGKTYLLTQGWSLQTTTRVSIADLAGIEGIFSHADTPQAIVHVVLAEDLYIRQFLPFPLRVTLEYQETTDADLEDTSGVTIVFSGQVELLEYSNTPSEEGQP